MQKQDLYENRNRYSVLAERPTTAENNLKRDQTSSHSAVRRSFAASKEGSKGPREESYAEEVRERPAPRNDNKQMETNPSNRGDPNNTRLYGNINPRDISYSTAVLPYCKDKEAPHGISQQ